MMSVVLKQLNEQMTNDEPLFSSYTNCTHQFVIYLTQEITVAVTSTSTKFNTTLATFFFGLF